MNLGLSLSLSSGSSGAATPWQPASLFEGGKEGAFYDPLSEGLTLGDAVTAFTDLSGNGHDLAQASGPKMPTWQGSHYLFDGADDAMAGIVGYDITLGLTVIIGFRQLGGANDDYFDIGSSSSNRYQFGDRAGYEMYAGSLLGIGDEDTSVHYATLFYNGASSYGRLDGAETTGNVGTSTILAAHQRCIGARVGGTAENANFELYGYIERHGELTPAEITQAEAWMAAQVGL